MLDPSRPIDAVRLVEFKRAGVIAFRRVDTSNQHDRVLYRHAGALPHMRLHRVACVSKQDDAPAAPQRKRLARQQRPLGRLRAGVDDALHLFMEAFVAFLDLAHLHVDGKQPVTPIGVGRAGDEIDLVAGVGEVVDDHVAVFLALLAII